MRPKKRIDVHIEIAKAALQLDQSDRETWIAHLLDERGVHLESDELFDVPFPTLPPGQTLVEYLALAFRAFEREPEHRDRLRTSVVNLIRTECDIPRVSNPDNVLGCLLIVARDCGFVEIENKLWGWVSANAFQESSCWDGAKECTLRSLIWSALLTWDLKPEWLPKLRRDLGRDDCRALCFRAIARLYPNEAVPCIPKLLESPTAFTVPLISDVFQQMGAEVVLDSSMLPAWQECLSTIENDDRLADYLYPEALEPSRPEHEHVNTLWRALQEAGILLNRARGHKFILRSTDHSHYLQVTADLLGPEQCKQVALDYANKDLQMNPEQFEDWALSPDRVGFTITGQIT